MFQTKGPNLKLHASLLVSWFVSFQNQLKALNLGKTAKNKSKVEGQGSNRSKGDKEASHDENPALDNMDDGCEIFFYYKIRVKTVILYE